MKTAQSLKQALEAELLNKYGPLIGGSDLTKALGYPSQDSFRQGVARGTVPVPIFSIPHRRGKFTLAKDLAAWLADQAVMASVRPLADKESLKNGGTHETLV